MQIPHMLQQHGARNHATLVAREIFEQLELLRQQRNLAAAAARRPRDQIDRQISDPQDGLLGNGLAAAAERLQPRQQFDIGERLDQLLLNAGPTVTGAVLDLAEIADDQDRHREYVVAHIVGWRLDRIRS